MGLLYLYWIGKRVFFDGKYWQGILEKAKNPSRVVELSKKKM
jgi:hypothetical protein